MWIGEVEEWRSGGGVEEWRSGGGVEEEWRSAARSGGAMGKGLRGGGVRDGEVRGDPVTVKICEMDYK